MKTGHLAALVALVWFLGGLACGVFVGRTW
jgi:hypothetical protein